jgi:hypothetical protein
VHVWPCACNQRGSATYRRYPIEKNQLRARAEGLEEGGDRVQVDTVGVGSAARVQNNKRAVKGHRSAHVTLCLVVPNIRVARGREVLHRMHARHCGARVDLRRRHSGSPQPGGRCLGVQDRTGAYEPSLIMQRAYTSLGSKSMPMQLFSERQRLWHWAVELANGK